MTAQAPPEPTLTEPAYLAAARITAPDERAAIDRAGQVWFRRTIDVALATELRVRLAGIEQQLRQLRETLAQPAPRPRRTWWRFPRRPR